MDDRGAPATETDTPILESPQAISTVDAAFIDALNLRTVAEALNYASGVRSQAFGSNTRIDYSQLRGFAGGNVFKDGLVLTDSGAFLSWTTPAEGIDRLEVLKGPSSVLHSGGGGGAGGLVNICSKAPAAAPLLAIEVDALGWRPDGNTSLTVRGSCARDRSNHPTGSSPTPDR